jgi:hypothetical protein
LPNGRRIGSLDDGGDQLHALTSSGTLDALTPEPFTPDALTPELLTPDAPAPPPATAYSGGGLFGIAYGLGVVDALAAAGVPVREADALGTSAGAWVATCASAGVSQDVLCALLPFRAPNPRPGWLRGKPNCIMRGYGGIAAVIRRVVNPSRGATFDR